MTKKTTEIIPTLPYWAIAQGEGEEMVLFETDNIIELDDALSDGSVSFGEEGKDFKVHALCMPWELFHAEVKRERGEGA